MTRKNFGKSITPAHPHTILKFKLINEYIKAWAQKLMNNDSCHSLVYIDCMCNSGIYQDDNGNEVDGTAILVAKTLEQVSQTYPKKQVELYFNDLDEKKTVLLKKHLPEETSNFHIHVQNMDMKAYLRNIGSQLRGKKYLHYFLLYDPYDAHIEWEVLVPFFHNWGEVLINHMVSDTIRALPSAKRAEAIEKYENTYLANLSDLLPFGSNKKAYEDRIHQIIDKIKGGQICYIGTFPVFNSKNALVYDLLHCTNNIEGFKLYQKCAWQVFNGRSSDKNISREPNLFQTEFDFEGEVDNSIKLSVDEECFGIPDIAEYLYKKYSGQGAIPVAKIWKDLELHPVFPSDGFRNQIKDILISTYAIKKCKVIDQTTGAKVEALDFE